MFACWYLAATCFLSVACVFVRVCGSFFISRACLTPASLISPSVCRHIAKQTFLETLQDNLIEMDILASARGNAAYDDGYVTRPGPATPERGRDQICFAMHRQ